MILGSSVESAPEFWQKIRSLFRPSTIATVESFRSFLSERAALIAQKCAIDYCRGKTGLSSYALFTEETFINALTVCRWETFAATLSDLMIVAEGYLRPHVAAADHNRLCSALCSLYRVILESQNQPEHRAAGWNDAIEAFTTRLVEAQTKPPQGALDVADHAARRLFETLPIHSTHRALDEEVVFGAVRFRMVAINQEMQRRVAAADVAKELLANATP